MCRRLYGLPRHRYSNLDGKHHKKRSKCRVREVHGASRACPPGLRPRAGLVSDVQAERGLAPNSKSMRILETKLSSVILLALTASLVHAPSASGEPLSYRPDDTFVTNGPVNAVVRDGSTIYIGGRFDRVGPRTGPGIEVGLDGSQNLGMPEISGAGPTSLFGAGGSVSAVASDGAGGWFVGGLFTHVGDSPRTNLAHIHADGSVDPDFAPNLNDAVRSIEVSGTTVYVAGSFTSIDGQARSRIASLNAEDGTLTAFNPDANAPVESLAVSSDGSTVYAGGRFTLIGGLPRISIAALNASDGRATLTFNPTATNSGGGIGVVNALALSGSTLYVGGTFNTIGGLPRNNLAALSLGLPVDGLAVPSFDPSPSRAACAACGSVAALAVSGSTVYAGGLFDQIGGQSRRYLAGLDAASGLATAFNPSPNGNIFDLATSGSRLYVSGGFKSSDGSPSIGGKPRNHIAAIQTDGTATDFDPNPNSLVTAIGVSGPAVYLGGSFSSIGGVVRRSMAAFNACDGTVTGFDPNAGGINAGFIPIVHALAVSGDTVYAGGYFGSAGGQPRGSLAALDAEDGSATGWNPSPAYGTGPAVIQAIVATESTVYAAGVFTTIGGKPRQNIAAVRATDASATDWNPNSNSVVSALELSGDLVYAGGHFTNIGGKARNKIAAIRVSDGVATTWDPNLTANGNVGALAVAGSTIYAGGGFDSVGGVPRKNIAGIDVATGAATAFNPQAADPNTGGGVSALAVHGSTVYAAGHFTTIGGKTRNLVAGLNASDGSATDFNPNGPPGFGAYALDVAVDGTLYVGGSFQTFDLAYQQGLAQFTPPNVNTECN